MSKVQPLVADTVGDLHREHGFWRVAAALAAAVLRERRKANDLKHFSDRMLLDIGVPENEVTNEYRMIRQPMVFWLGFRL
ncbi:hypothetical protein SAMN05880590_107290 [Rhizobium sp. RU35A]|uniref:DUF1127 domain-containing protein n=1 Tax=Rhizobium sp. RU35A TaxID=1907414 RepID=UPI0009557854|nr:DUF1127 domain-containing protein [Rhizobium sp. RU35A]SIQ81124.1 hypothetical protein SAMN05880590_107290 [Rhizobium sp. RU35A]